VLLDHARVFEENRYFDVFVDYAKASEDDILIRITAVNRGPDLAEIDLLPTLWFRNTWSWSAGAAKPVLRAEGDHVVAEHPAEGRFNLYFEDRPGLLFTENETNAQRLYGVPNATPYVKDAFHEYVVNGRAAAVNPARAGTKFAAHHRFVLSPGATAEVRLRLMKGERAKPFADFEEVFAARSREADEFYATVTPPDLSDDARLVMRQSLGGLLWSKQFYHYVVRDWLHGAGRWAGDHPAPRQGGGDQRALVQRAAVDGGVGARGGGRAQRGGLRRDGRRGGAVVRAHVLEQVARMPLRRGAPRWRRRRIRPNQIFAVSLPFPLLGPEQQRRVVDVVERELLTRVGLRTLAPAEDGYLRRYRGGSAERDGAYHQGTVWPWVLGPFVRAYLRVHGRTAETLARCRGFLGGMARHMEDGCLGTVSEVFDAEAPHHPGGAPAQAWSVAELYQLAAVELRDADLTPRARTTAVAQGRF
jgi:hypothetical protein